MSTRLEMPTDNASTDVDTPSRLCNDQRRTSCIRGEPFSADRTITRKYRMTNALLNRRGFMQIGALALGGLTLPEILAAREASGSHDSDTSVIMLYQHGGASQLETYDLKPNAPTS